MEKAFELNNNLIFIDYKEIFGQLADRLTNHFTHLDWIFIA